MPGSSRRVRAMSDELAPAGALRLARVAGVPVYLDRTWLLLGAFVAWTGWQQRQRPGHRDGAWRPPCGMVVGILVAVLGHEVAHAVAARLLGFRVHRIVATLWGGHTAYDGTGSTPGPRGRHRRRRPAGQPRAGRRSGGAMVGAPAVAGIPSSPGLFMFLNLLLAGFNLLPGLPLDGGQLVQSLVWGVSGRRDLGLVVAGLVRPGARRGGRALVRRPARWPRASPTLFGIGLGPGHGLDPLVGRDGGPPARPARAAARCGCARRTSWSRSRSCRPRPRSVRWSASTGGWWPSTSRAGPPSLLPDCRRRRRPTSRRLPPTTPLASLVVKRARRVRRRARSRVDDAEPVLRAMAMTGPPVVVVTWAGTGARSGHLRAAQRRGREPCSAATRLPGP